MIVEDCFFFAAVFLQLLELLQLLSTKQRWRAFLVKWLMHFSFAKTNRHSINTFAGRVQRHKGLKCLELKGTPNRVISDVQWHVLLIACHCDENVTHDHYQSRESAHARFSLSLRSLLSPDYWICKYPIASWFGIANDPFRVDVLNDSISNEWVMSTHWA